MSAIAKIETWLRKIIRDEVSKLDTNLNTERLALFSSIRALDGQVKSFEEVFSKAVSQVLSCSPPHQENAQLRETIKTLSGSIAECRSLVDRVAHPEKYYHEGHQQV